MPHFSDISVSPEQKRSVRVHAAAIVLVEAVSAWQWLGVLIILAGIAFPHLMEKKISSGLVEDAA
ncbi:hypothetical protein McpSp1_04970 [Methanocorpusculaceae archaeon Sp1]|nr:hypothetical protein [Methanocorpusculaceae archaeon Sp1]